MKQYEAYKDSSIQWLGEIPSHWKVGKLKHVATCNDEVLSENTDPELHIDYVEISDVDSIDGIKCKTNYAFKEAPSRARRITRPGDVIISTVRTYLKAITSIKESDLIVSTGFAVIRPKKIDSTFLKYSLLYEGFIDQVIARSVGVSYPAITSTELMGIEIIVPPLAEQEVIAAYLDLKVGQIDAILSEKEAMVEQLQQYRKSLISETVTRGLNPKVPMKDSGIDWIGQIPQHWDVKKIGFIFDNLDYLRQPVASENRERNNPQYDYYGASGVIDKIDYYNVDDKVLLIGEDGANLVARNLPLVYKAEGKFWVNNHAHILKPKDDDYDYMAHALEAADYTLYITGSAQPKLSQDNLQSVKLPVPPIEEQKRIAVFLNEIALKIDSSICELQSQIEDLKAYKSSVITEAVTGKVDLRDWKPSEENA